MGNGPSCNQNAIPAPAPSETLFLVDQHPNLDRDRCGAFSVPLNVGDLNGATMGKLQGAYLLVLCNFHLLSFFLLVFHSLSIDRPSHSNSPPLL